MLKKLAGAVVTLGAVVMLTGCLRAPVMPPWGLVYTDYKAPLDYDQEQSQAANLKSGTAQTISILGLVALGDGSIKTAAENGNISQIHGADYEYFNVIGVYQRYRTVVHGE